MIPSIPSLLPGAALLCIDMQPKFIKTLADHQSLLKRTKLAVASAAELRIPVFFTEHRPKQWGKMDRSLRKLAPEAPVFTKHTYSALEVTDLAESLQSLQIEHLLICGIEASICIYQTVISALNQDLQVTLLTDAISGRRSFDTQSCLQALARLEVAQLPVETILYSILGSEEHPFCPMINQLVETYE